MKLEGMKINFLGDSITEGYGLKSDEATFWNILKRECGLAAARGYGIGGTRIAVQHCPADPIIDQDFISRVELMDPDVDVIVVFGGTNDFGHGDAPLGHIRDRSPYTFYGAIHTLARKLLTRYPDAQIVFMTPLHRAVEDQGGRRLPDFVEAIRQVAAYYGIPVADMYTTCQIQPQIPEVRAHLCPDGLHPNEAGHFRIYQRLRGFLESL